MRHLLAVVLAAVMAAAVFFSQGFAVLLLEGLAAVLGGAMITPAVIRLVVPRVTPSRWRGTDRGAVGAPEPTAAGLTG